MSGKYSVHVCYEDDSEQLSLPTLNVSSMNLQIQEDTVIAETNNGFVYTGRKSPYSLQLISKNSSHVMILIRSGDGLRAGLYSYSSYQLIAVLDLFVNRLTQGLRGLRASPLFLDCVSGAVSTCMAYQLMCSQQISNILRKEGLEIVLTPLFQNGLRMEYKKLIAADVLSADYQVAEIVSSCADPVSPETANRTPKTVMRNTKDPTVLDCGLQLEKYIQSLQPSSSLTIDEVNAFLISEANPIDEVMFQVIKRPRLLSSRNPNIDTIFTFFHLIILLLSYHSCTPISSETSSSAFNDERLFIVIMEQLYTQANHLLQWLNDKRVRSEKSWNDLSAMREELIQLLLYVEPAGLSLEAVSCV